MVKLLNQSQLNQGPRSPGSLCTKGPVLYIECHIYILCILHRKHILADEGEPQTFSGTPIHVLPIIQTCEDDGEHDTEWDCDGLMGCCKQTQNGER